MNLRKMKDRVDALALAEEPIKPTICAMLRPGDLIEFQGKLWNSLEQIHAAYPDRFGHDPEGCIAVVVDADGNEGPAPWLPGELERMEVMG